MRSLVFTAVQRGVCGGARAGAGVQHGINGVFFMNKPLRILHLEDEPDFSTLVSAILEKEGLDAEIFLATDWTSFCAALDKDSFDLILGDYMLPTCNGIQALQQARQKRPNVPFLLLSGAIGEQAAIEFLRSGATDYVLKNRLDRLVPAIRQAIEAAHERPQDVAVESVPRPSETQYQMIFDRSPVPMWVSDPRTGAFLEVNEAAIQQYGYSRDEFLVRTANDICSAEEAARLAEYLRQAADLGAATGTEYAGVWRHRNRNGTMTEVDITWCLTRFQDRDALLTMARKVAEQPPPVEVSKESDTRLAAAQRIARLGTWDLSAVDPQNILAGKLQWSDETYRIFGIKSPRTPATIESFLSAVHPEDRDRVKDALATALRRKEPLDLDHRIVLPDGETRIVWQRAECSLDDSGNPVQMRGVVMDVTAQRQSEEQCNQSRRMDAVGELSGSAAQEFGEVLIETQRHAMALLGEKRLSDPARASAQQIVRAAESAAGLTRSLLTFGRRMAMEPRRIDLNELLGNLTGALENVLGGSIELQFKRCPQPAFVQADPALMEQVLLHLTLNAREATRKGGHVAIEIFPISLNADNLNYHPAGRAGKFICLSFADNGRGMAPSDLHRLFEPSFPAKDAENRGAPRLAAAYGIVKQHEGWIEVESESGNGATFRVYLPVSKEKDEAAGGRGVRRPVRGGKETILVVDGETTAREWAGSILTSLGYTVLQAGSGAKALEVGRRSKTKIGVLLTEAVLPDPLDGRELADKLRKNRPQLKVIFSSGYDRDVIGKDFVQRGQQFLRKPYDLETLAFTVRACLDRAR